LSAVQGLGEGLGDGLGLGDGVFATPIWIRPFTVA
jgi:hypothetical protein